MQRHWAELMHMPESASGTRGPEERARAPWPFAGRAEEFDIITSAIAASSAGRAARAAGSGAVVVAPAGVGKTRLLAEVRAWAQQQGLRTATIIATAAASRTPYGAVLHLLPIDTADPTDRATWHAAFATALRADGRPTVLVVDDAQHLDPGSAALVLQLAMEGAAIPVVSVRRGEAVHDSITALWKNSLALRVDLQPFSGADMRGLIATALGESVSDRTLHRLEAVCDGNVLYARELVAGAIEAGSLRLRDDVWSWDEQVVLAPRLVEAVGARLAVLSEDERQALAVVALGEPLPPHVAEQLTSSAALTALEDAGLIRISGADLSADLRLAHPLYGEVVLAQLGRLTRRRLLTALADALDGDPQLTDATVFRAVSWRLEAGGQQSPQRLLQAAVRANQAFDHLLAERLARAGLQALDGPEPPREALTIELALALLRDNRHAEAHTLLVGIEEDVVASADGPLQDNYLDTRFWACALGLGHVDEVRGVLDRYAEAHLGAGRPRAGLAAYRANLLLWEGRPAAALALVEPLVQGEAGPLPDLQRLLALETCSEALVNLGLHGQVVPVWEQLRAMEAVGTGRALTAAAEAELQGLYAAQLDGRYAEILPAVTAIRAQLENSPDLVTRGLASMSLGRVLSKTGQLARAHAVLLDALADFRQIDLGGSLAWTLVLLASNAVQLGRLEDARRWRDEADRLLGPEPTSRLAADTATADVWLAVAQGDRTRAGALAIAAADRYPELALARAGLLHLAFRVGERGADTAGALRELAGQTECDYPTLLADHAEAIRAGDGAVLESVAERFASRGLAVHAAEAARHAAMAYRAAGSTDGAHRASARAAGLAAGFDDFTTPALEDPQPVLNLSRRELDVARLAASGLSNAQIAERLVVSVRTVESHLYQGFAKLGVERRRDLARFLPGPRSSPATDRAGASDVRGR